MQMRKQKKWNAYIMVCKIKIYLCKHMTTSEIVKWLKDNCKVQNASYFKYNSEVFYECK